MPNDAHDKAIVAQAAARWQVPLWVLWGVYGAESTYGTAGNGNPFGLTGIQTGELAKDANTAARLLRGCWGHAGVHSWDDALRVYNTGSPHVMAAPGAATTDYAATVHRLGNAPASASNQDIPSGGISTGSVISGTPNLSGCGTTGITAIIGIIIIMIRPKAIKQ